MSHAYHQHINVGERIIADLSQSEVAEIYGRVYAIDGGVVCVTGLKGMVVIGGVCFIQADDGERLYGEVIGFEGDITKVMTVNALGKVRNGLPVFFVPKEIVQPSNLWLGHVVNAFGQIHTESGLKTLPQGSKPYPLRANPPPASRRRGLGARLETQSAVFNSFLPICRGQRVGLFAGSGVGKSTLMSYFAKNVDADIVVIGLIGERGREVNEFVHKTLTKEMRKKCVIVAVSSDESALIKRRGAYLTLSVAEYFRDQGHNVVLLFDSLTRLAESQREIGLMAGEPPAMRAFPPSSFTEVMGLCERAGPGCLSDNGGDITAFFTVLVQGGDMDEPVADCVRGTLDGHIVLDRNIAEKGLYPAVDILKSVSRSLPDCALKSENDIMRKVRRIISEYKDIEPMVKLGIYKKGLSVDADYAVQIYPKIEDILYSVEKYNVETTFKKLTEIITKSTVHTKN